jgi:hypothetical protein
MRRRTSAVLVWGIGVLAGCRTAVNYAGPVGPRYAGFVSPVAAAAADTIRLVTFNIQFARHIDSAIALLRAEPLAHADVVTLQEMDAPGTQRIAAALGLSYVSNHRTRFR